jgi:hypothetical protein
MSHAQRPPTFDDVAGVLPPIVRGLEQIAQSLDVLVEITLRATNLPEESADALADLGDSLIKHGHRIMGEAVARRRSGRGAAPIPTGPHEPAPQDEDDPGGSSDAP